MTSQATPIKSAKMMKTIDAKTDACSLANLKKSRVLTCVVWFDALSSSAEREISFSRAARSRLIRDAGVKLLLTSLVREDFRRRARYQLRSWWYESGASVEKGGNFLRGAGSYFAT